MRIKKNQLVSLLEIIIIFFGHEFDTINSALIFFRITTDINLTLATITTLVLSLQKPFDISIANMIANRVINCPTKIIQMQIQSREINAPKKRSGGIQYLGLKLDQFSNKGSYQKRNFGDLSSKMKHESSFAESISEIIKLFQTDNQLSSIQSDPIDLAQHVIEKVSSLPKNTFVVDENSHAIIKKRYLINENEKPEEWLARVATRLSIVEMLYHQDSKKATTFFDKLFALMYQRKFLPAGRTLANANGTIVPNCIVLNIHDSMQSIYGTLLEASILQQYGSGLGFPFHLLRPAGFPTRTSKGEASGPVSFLVRSYNSSFTTIKQHNRHGANMAVMRVDHPDILEFIHCKDKEGEVSCFNCSVALTDEFMIQAINPNETRPWLCSWDGKLMKPRRIKRDRDYRFLEAIPVDMTAREILREIVRSAWSMGEPGVIFIDTVNRANPLPGLGKLEASNPCGEQMLHSHDACNLGSINLAEFVDLKTRKFMFSQLEDAVKTSVRALDNVIDCYRIPIQLVQAMTTANRRLGLGVMGVGKMLCRMSIPYDSAEGRHICERIMKMIQDIAIETSRQLANEKGVFANFSLSVFDVNDLRRNAALTSCAPTGTISNCIGTSGGIEPHFAFAYNRTFQNRKLEYIDQDLIRELEKCGAIQEGLNPTCYSRESELLKMLISYGSLKKVNEMRPDLCKKIPHSILRAFVCALDISAEDHIRMQAAFQKYVDNSISKTINFPHSATLDDVEKGYIEAWKNNCKGCTAYRDASRQIQVLNLNTNPTPESTTTTNTILPHSSSILTVVDGNLAVLSQNNANNKVPSLNRIAKQQCSTCPECKNDGTLKKSEGCLSCYQCGWSVCQ